MECNYIGRSQPKVSVIVPVFNVEQYIERCAISLFEQTLQEMEYIFVDDASPDNSISILKSCIEKYPNRKEQIKIVTHETNKGLPTARNTGVKISSGQYVIHCDSDDWVERDMYQVLYEEASRRNCDVVWSDFFMEFKDNTIEWKAVSLKNDISSQIKAYLSYGWNVVWNMLVRREIYFLNNLQSYDGYGFGEDYALTIRVLCFAQKCGYIPRPLYHYNRANQSSMVNSFIMEDKARDEIALNFKVIDFYKERNMYEPYVEQFSWRMLKAKRGLLFLYKRRSEYLAIMPESNKYIDSNPLCSNKDKFCQKVILKPYWFLILPCVEFLIKIRTNLIRLRYR